MGSSILVREHLRDIIARLEKLNDDDVICVEGRPSWTSASPAYLVHVPLDLPPEDRRPIQDYFLEVFVARDVLEGWSLMRDGRQPSLDESCEALIYYALNDAPMLPE